MTPQQAELTIYGLWMFGAWLIAFLVISCMGANLRAKSRLYDLQFMIRISEMGRKQPSPHAIREEELDGT